MGNAEKRNQMRKREKRVREGKSVRVWFWLG